LLSSNSGRTTATPDKTKLSGQVNIMMSTRLIQRSIATATLATALVVTPIAVQAQDAAPPPPDQYNNQDQYAMQSGVQQDQAVPQPGAPQGIQQAPPPIPDYEQPPAPGDGYIWTPGYWAWTGDGYEWIQGAWVAAPYTGALWTPGYWGYAPYGYFWNAGYWGPYVGYYGGINYGFGYFGIGFYGGYWGGGRFWYNRAYCNYHGGWGYSRPYNGYSGRPGGASFVHGTAVSANRGVTSTAYRGSTINGRTANYAQGQGRSNYTGSTSTPARAYTGAGNFNGAANYNGTARSYSAPTQNYSNGARNNYAAPAQNYGNTGRSYAQPTSRFSQSYSGGASSYAQPSQSYTGRSYSTPSAGSFHGGAMSSPSGSFHGGGGGGGGFHGGGGGHR
jgi:hypothetical protein